MCVCERERGKSSMHGACVSSSSMHGMQGGSVYSLVTACHAPLHASTLQHSSSIAGLSPEPWAGYWLGLGFPFLSFIGR